jgi:hypothetical protein
MFVCYCICGNVEGFYVEIQVSGSYELLEQRKLTKQKSSHLVFTAGLLPVLAADVSF